MLIFVADICYDCAEEWLFGAFNKQFDYQDSPLYVIKREKGEIPESDDEEPSKEPVCELFTVSFFSHFHSLCLPSSTLKLTNVW